MSWLSDFVSDAYGGAISPIASGARQFGMNDLASFFQSEVDKSKLRGAEVEGFLSGMPVVGDVIRGVEGVNQMEDLYNNTGKVVNYPGSQNMGTSSLAHVPGDISRKIEDGSHSLSEFYSGDRSIDNVFDSINGSSSRALTSVNSGHDRGWKSII